jgi:hypothetical protein
MLWTSMISLLGLLAIGSFPSQDPEILKDELRYLMYDVQAAARDKDFDALEKILPPVFKYSLGGDDTREGALRYYRQNPEKLDVLFSILEAGCKKDGEFNYWCPPQNADREVIYLGPRVGFVYDQKAKKWLFKYFVEGD